MHRQLYICIQRERDKINTLWLWYCFALDCVLKKTLFCWKITQHIAVIYVYIPWLWYCFVHTLVLQNGNTTGRHVLLRYQHPQTVLLLCFGLSLNPLLRGRWTVFKPLVLQNGNTRDKTTHDICLEHPLTVLLLCCELSLRPLFCRTATQEAVMNTPTVLLLCCELSLSPLFCRRWLSWWRTTWNQWGQGSCCSAKRRKLQEMRMGDWWSPSSMSRERQGRMCLKLSS